MSANPAVRANELLEQFAAVKQLYATELQVNLLEFVRYTHPNYVADLFHVELCRILEKFHSDVVAGRSPRVIVSAPPQHGKSAVVSRRYPAWALGKNPNFSILGCSYNQDWSELLCRDVAKVMDSSEFHDVFPQVAIPGAWAAKSDAKRVSDYFELATHSGRYKAVGRGGGAAGRPAHILLIDDPCKNAEEAMSQTTRDAVWQWYQMDLYTRLQQGAGVLVMATRWHLDDLIGRLLEAEKAGGDKWQVYVFPAIKQGEALAPHRFNLEALEAIKRNQSDAVWSALYMGSPVALEGNILPASKWRYYGGPGQPALPGLNQFNLIIQSWDGSFKDSAGSDFCAGQVWGLRGAERWMLAYTLEKMAYPRFKQAIREMSYQWPKSSWKLIESAANGAAVVSDLETEISGITPINPEGGKIARAWAASADLCAGNCFIPDPSIEPRIAGFVQRCAVFPANINRPGSDDDVDAFTQLINFARSKNLTLGLVMYFKEQQAKAAAARIPIETGPCRQCGSPSMQKIPGGNRCMQCGHQVNNSQLVAQVTAFNKMQQDNARRFRVR